MCCCPDVLASSRPNWGGAWQERATMGKSLSTVAQNTSNRFFPAGLPLVYILQCMSRFSSLRLRRLSPIWSTACIKVSRDSIGKRMLARRGSVPDLGFGPLNLNKYKEIPNDVE